jgi:hypothetical protein
MANLPGSRRNEMNKQQKAEFATMLTKHRAKQTTKAEMDAFWGTLTNSARRQFNNYIRFGGEPKAPKESVVRETKTFDLSKLGDVLVSKEFAGSFRKVRATVDDTLLSVPGAVSVRMEFPSGADNKAELRDVVYEIIEAAGDLISGADYGTFAEELSVVYLYIPAEELDKFMAIAKPIHDAVMLKRKLGGRKHERTVSYFTDHDMYTDGVSYKTVPYKMYAQG